MLLRPQWQEKCSIDDLIHQYKYTLLIIYEWEIKIIDINQYRKSFSINKLNIKYHGMKKESSRV